MTMTGKSVAIVFILFGLSQSGLAQKEIPMSTEKGIITLLFEGITTNRLYSTLQGSIRNDTPNELTRLVFEVVAYDQNGADLRMCDVSNTNSRCNFQIPAPLKSGQTIRIAPLYGEFRPGRVIANKLQLAKIKWRVVTAQFAPLPVINPDPKLPFSPNNGDIVIWDIAFIPPSDARAELSFRVVNQTPYLGSETTHGLGGTLWIKLQADGLCEGKTTQWISDANWLLPRSYKYYKDYWTTTTKVSADACKLQSFKGQLTLDADSALANAYDFFLPLRIDAVGEPSGSNILVFHIQNRILQILAQQTADKLAAAAAKADQDAKDAAEAAARAEDERKAAEAQAKKDATESVRRKRVVAEQRKNDAEQDARLAKYRAEEEAKAAFERTKIRAACSVIYRNTVDKKISNLTVREEQQVRACQALGLYPPQ